MSDLTFQYIHSQGNHAAGILASMSWGSPAEMWDHMTTVPIQPSTGFAEMSIDLAWVGEGIDTVYLEDDWNYWSTLDYEGLILLQRQHIHSDTSTGGTYNRFRVTSGIIWFDLTWVASTMYVENATLRLNVSRMNNKDDYRLHGEWVHPSEMGSGDYPIHFYDFRAIQEGEKAFEPFDVSDIPNRDAGTGFEYETIDVPLVDPEPHLHYGDYVGIRLFFGNDQPWSEQKSYDDPDLHVLGNILSIQSYEDSPGSDPADIGPLLIAGLTCTEPDDDGDSSGGIFDQGFDDSDLLRDRLPANSIEAMLYQHPQSVSRLKAKVRQNESE